MKITMLDPIPIERDSLTKHKHLFEEGQRVTVIEGAHSGRSGKLIAINAHGGHVVRLDSGHDVEYSDRELEPEGFSRQATRTLDRVQKAHDPWPLGDELGEVRAKTFSPGARELFRPCLKSIAVLNRALEAGTVSTYDRVLMKTAIENIEAARVIVDPLDLFGETEEHNARILRIMAEKYAGTSAGETLTKAAHRDPSTDPEFRVGQSVRDRRTGKKGKIFKLDYGFAGVQYEGGELHCPCGDLEAVA